MQLWLELRTWESWVCYISVELYSLQTAFIVVKLHSFNIFPSLMYIGIIWGFIKISVLTHQVWAVVWESAFLQGPVDTCCWFTFSSKTPFPLASPLLQVRPLRVDMLNDQLCHMARAGQARSSTWEAWFRPAPGPSPLDVAENSAYRETL